MAAFGRLGALSFERCAETQSTLQNSSDDGSAFRLWGDEDCSQKAPSRSLDSATTTTNVSATSDTTDWSCDIHPLHRSAHSSSKQKMDSNPVPENISSEFPSRRRQFTFMVLITLAQLVQMIPLGAGINSGLAIGEALGATALQSTWIVASYPLTQGSFVLIGKRDFSSLLTFLWIMRIDH